MYDKTHIILPNFFAAVPEFEYLLLISMILKFFFLIH